MLSVIFDEQLEYRVLTLQLLSSFASTQPLRPLTSSRAQSAGLLARASDRRRHRAAAQRDRQDCQAALVSQGIVDVDADADVRYSGVGLCFLLTRGRYMCVVCVLDVCHWLCVCQSLVLFFAR